MRKWLLRAVYVALVLTPIAAMADYLATAGGATTVFAFVCSATKVCPAFVLIDSTNVEKATAGNPLRVDPTGTTTQPVSQPTAANLNATVVQATAANLNATVTGTVNPTTAANWGIGTSTYNSALATNGQLALGQFQTSPGAMTTTNMAPFQLDANGNLRVNVMTGASGGLSVMDTAGFTAGSSNFTPGGGVFNDTATLTTGQQGTFRMTTKRAQIIDVDTTGNQLHADMIAPIPAGTAHIGTVGTAPYPDTAVPYTSSTTGTTTAITATLAGAASVTTYICGFSVRANATAAATNNIVVSGTISGSINFTQWTAVNTGGLGVSEQVFMPCIPASAANTSIVVTTGAAGAGGVISVAAWGYKL